ADHRKAHLAATTRREIHAHREMSSEAIREGVSDVQERAPVLKTHQFEPDVIVPGSEWPLGSIQVHLHVVLTRARNVVSKLDPKSIGERLVIFLADSDRQHGALAVCDRVAVLDI